MSLTPGTRLGPYEITALIGEGGMGKVWRAHHTALKRDDAIRCCRMRSRLTLTASLDSGERQDARLPQSSEHRPLHGLEKAEE